MPHFIGKERSGNPNTGPMWNAKDNVYPIEYLSPAAYTGEQAWINYQGAWGNKGDTTCWWYPIVKVS